VLEGLGQLVQGLEFDRVWPDLVVRNVHVFHAVVSAFSAYFWAHEGWTGPEDLLEGDPPEAAERGEPGDDPDHDHVAQPEKLARAVDELGDLWLEDGWIWAPPRRRSST
jgi:hypothetical protein